MRYFSVTEHPLAWSWPGFVEVVAVSELGEGVTNLGTRYPDLAARVETLGAYATLFAIRRLLEADEPEAAEPAARDTPMVGIAHQGGIVTTRSTGRPGLPEAAVEPDSVADLPRDLLVPRAGVVVFPNPSLLVSALHLGAPESVRDALFVLGLAIDLGVVSNEQVTESIGRAVVVSRPYLGVYPVSWMIQTLTQLEQVAEAFQSAWLDPSAERRDPSIVSSLERLHVILLEELVRERPAAAIINRPISILDATRAGRG